MNTTNTDYFAEFKSELCENIKKTIRNLKRDGTVAMSERNLLRTNGNKRAVGLRSDVRRSSKHAAGS